MKKFILHPFVMVLLLMVIRSGSLNAQNQGTKLYVTGTVSADANMLVSVRGSKTIEGTVVTAELNGKKTQMRTNKNGQAILDLSAISAGLVAPTVAVIKSFDKKGNLLSTANTTVLPGNIQTATAPVIDNLPANQSNNDMIIIKGRNLGADAKLVIGDKVQETLASSDKEMIVSTNSNTGEQPVYVTTPNGVSNSQMVNIYSLDFSLPKQSILPAEKVQAKVQYKNIPVGTKLLFTNMSPTTIMMKIPGAVNTANECIYTVNEPNGTLPVNITGMIRGDFKIGLDFNFSDESEIDYDKITKRDQLPKLIIPGYDKYSAERAINKLSHEEAMKKAFESEEARDRWSKVFKTIYGK